MTLQPFPQACEDCEADQRRSFGCGHDDSTRGRSDVIYERGAKDGDESRTCPAYYLGFPAISSIMRDLGDYKRGSLGNILDLPAPQLDLLRIAEAELAEWEAEQHRSLNEKSE